MENTIRKNPVNSCVCRTSRFTEGMQNFLCAAKKKRRKERLLQLRQQTEEDKIFDMKVKAIEQKIARTDICELFPEFRLNKVV